MMISATQADSEDVTLLIPPDKEEVKSDNDDQCVYEETIIPILEAKELQITI